MSALDIAKYHNQLYYLVVTFWGFYFILGSEVIPNIYRALKTRNAYLNLLYKQVHLVGQTVCTTNKLSTLYIYNFINNLITLDKKFKLFYISYILSIKKIIKKN